MSVERGEQHTGLQRDRNSALQGGLRVGDVREAEDRPLTATAIRCRGVLEQPEQDAEHDLLDDGGAETADRIAPW